MQVNVVHRLTSVVTAVEGAAESRPRDSQLRRQMLHGLKKILENVRVIGLHVQNIYEVLFGDDKDMNRRLRADIPEGKYLVVFKDLLAGKCSSDNFAKNALL